MRTLNWKIAIKCIMFVQLSIYNVPYILFTAGMGSRLGVRRFMGLGSREKVLKNRRVPTP